MFEEVIQKAMLMMREANERVQKQKSPERNWKAEDAKSQRRQKPHKLARKAAKAKTTPAEEKLGMQRMRKAKAKKPPQAAETNKKPKSQEAKKPRSEKKKKKEEDTNKIKEQNPI